VDVRWIPGWDYERKAERDIQKALTSYQGCKNLAISEEL